MFYNEQLTIQPCEPQVYKIAVNIAKEHQDDLEAILTKLGKIFSTLENDLTLRNQIKALPNYPTRSTSSSHVFVGIQTFGQQAHSSSMGTPSQVLALISKLHPKTFFIAMSIMTRFVPFPGSGNGPTVFR